MMAKKRYQAYPEMKDSGFMWLGAVPKSWEVLPFKHMVSIQNGSDYKHIERESGIPVIGSGGIFTYASEFMFDGESVLLGRKGTIDKPLYMNGKFWTVDTMYWTKISSNACGRFVYYLALSIPFNYYSTNTALPSMTKEALSSHVVVRPSIEEQQAIANFLDRKTSLIDDLIAKKERMIMLLKEKRQETITQAVTRGLDPYTELDDSGVEWIGKKPKHWEIKRLKYLCDIRTGDKDTVNAIDDGIYPFFVRSQTIERINSYSYDCEAILTAGDGVGVGKVFHYYNGKFDFHQRVYMFNNFRHATGRFIYYFFKENFYKVALEGAAKSTVDSLRRPMLLNFFILVPPLNEQVTIVNYLEQLTYNIDSVISKLIIQIDKLKEYRQSLIFNTVTGKIKVS